MNSTSQGRVIARHADHPTITSADQYYEEAAARSGAAPPPPRQNGSAATASGGPGVGSRTSARSVQEGALKVIKREFRSLQLDKNIGKQSVFGLIETCEQSYEASRTATVAASMVQNYIRGYLIFSYFINNSIMLKFGGFQNFLETSEQDFLIYINLFNFFDSDRSTDLKQLRELIERFLVAGKYLEFDMEVLIDWLHNYLRYLKEKDEYDAMSESEESDSVYDMNGIRNELPRIDTTRQEEGGDEAEDEYYYEGGDSNSLSSFKEKYPSVKSTPIALTGSSTFPPANGSFGTKSLEYQYQPPQSNHASESSPYGSTSDDSRRRSPERLENQRMESSPSPWKPQLDKYVSSSSPIHLGNAQVSSSPSHGASLSPYGSPGKLPSYPYGSSTRKPPVDIFPTPSPPPKANTFNSHHPGHAGYTSETTSHSTSQHSNISAAHTNTTLASSPSPAGQPFYQTQNFNGDSTNYPRATQMVPTVPNGGGNVAQAQAQPLASFSRPAVPRPPVPAVNHAQTVHSMQQYQQPQNQAPSQQYYQASQPQLYNQPQPFTQNQPQQYQATRAQTVPSFVKNPDQLRQEKLDYMRLHAICGLKNFGSSCYINSTIQLLFGLVQFKSIFTNSRYHKYIRDPKYIEQFNLNSSEPILLSVAVSGLLKSFLSHGGCGIAPSKFLRISSKLKPNFNIPNEQQDAQEFLLFVLERLHDELSIKNLKEDVVDSIIVKTEVKINSKDKDEYVKWYKSLIDREGVSPVNDLLQGHLQNKLICNKCGYESVTYSPFNMLSLPIPNSTRGPGGSVDLSECLRYYIKDEVLTGENAWNCPKCSEKSLQPPQSSSLDSHPVFVAPKKGLFHRTKSPVRKAAKTPPANGSAKVDPSSISIKRLSFIKLPQILLIHLSRFSMFNLTDKLDTTIKYPLQLKFNDPTSADGSSKILYKLTGLINHFGNLKSGHYTALVNKSTFHQQMSDDTHLRLNNIDNLTSPYWCYFDDDIIDSSVSHGNINHKQGPLMAEMSSKEVYVLCYERVA